MHLVNASSPLIAEVVEQYRTTLRDGKQPVRLADKLQLDDITTSMPRSMRRGSTMSSNFNFRQRRASRTTSEAPQASRHGAVERERRTSGAHGEALKAARAQAARARAARAAARERAAEEQDALEAVEADGEAGTDRIKKDLAKIKVASDRKVAELKAHKEKMEQKRNEAKNKVEEAESKRKRQSLALRDAEKKVADAALADAKDHAAKEIEKQKAKLREKDIELEVPSSLPPPSYLPSIYMCRLSLRFYFLPCHLSYLPPCAGAKDVCGQSEARAKRGRR